MLSTEDAPAGGMWQQMFLNQWSVRIGGGTAVLPGRGQSSATVNVTRTTCLPTRGVYLSPTGLSP